MNTDTRAYRLVANGPVPNNPNCPLLVYAAHADSGRNDLARYLERLFASHGWVGSWRNGIFGMHHWHSTAHEVLGIYSGTASVQFGGEGGLTVEARAGDVIVVPAGVAHKRLSGPTGLGVVGAYADGRRPDMCTPEGAARESHSAVAAVPLPQFDPVYGADGPLFEHWRTANMP